MINFKEITEENFDAIINMKRPEGEKFVAPNSISLAQAWLYREAGDVFPKAIYNDDKVVGFILLEEDMDEKKLMLWRIMFPVEHENKGYGTEAVKLMIKEAKAADKYDGIFLDCDPDNIKARHLYDKLGFVETGDINHGSIEMCYHLTTDMTEQ